MINLFYNIDPLFLNYFYHINYTTLFHSYWFTGFLESHLSYFSISINQIVPNKDTFHSYRLTPFSPFLGNQLSTQPPFKNSPSSPLKAGSLPLSSPVQRDLSIFTSIFFEFHLYDNNYYNLLLINKFFKGKIIFINRTYKLILKFPFGVNEILFIIQYLNNYPFLTSKYSNYLKLRKIYRICQRKENYYHKGLLSIFQICNSNPYKF